MNIERSHLHDYLAHREEMAARLTVADRVVRNVEARTLDRAPGGVGRGRMLLVVATVAVLLLAGIGVPRLLLAHHHSSGQWQPAGPPQGVPDRRPPAGIALVWVRDPASFQRAIALDRNGRPMGWLPVGYMMQGETVTQSGDGQRIITGDGQSYELTAQGQRIDLPPTALDLGGGAYEPYDVFFSDDEQSVCIEQGPWGTPRNLVLVDGSGHVSTSIPEAPADNPSWLSWHVVTCSVRNDVAVLVGDPDAQRAAGPQPPPTQTTTHLPNGQNVSSIGVGGSVSAPKNVQVPAGGPYHIIRVVRLSTGREIARRVYGAQTPQPVDASEDGTLVLETLGTGGGHVLRNIASGAVVGTVGPATGLLGNTVAQNDVWTGSGPRSYSVVDIPSGRVLWSLSAPLGLKVTYPALDQLAVTQVYQGLDCPSHADVTITDLAGGVTHRVTLDTCGGG